MKKRNISLALFLAIFSDLAVAQSDTIVEKSFSRITETVRNNRTGAVSTVGSEELQHHSSLDFSEALYGLLPGVNVSQRVGWLDVAATTVRNGGSLTTSSPLIIVDGVPRSLQYVNVQDVESVRVLKDGAATAIWGTRGANGVLLITTKRGLKRTKQVEVNYTYGMGLPINQPKFVDAFTFALAKNEACRLDGIPEAYNIEALNTIKQGTNPDLYPNVDWMKEGFRDFSVNHQANVILRGGSDRVTYYGAINYRNEVGLLNPRYTSYSERYNSQMKKYDLSARLNLDVEVTRYTKIGLSMLGLLRENARPLTEENALFGNLYHVPAIAFPVKTSKGNWGSHPLYEYNPIATIADVGRFKRNERLLQSDAYLYQDLSFITPGLSAQATVAYDNSAVFQEKSTKTYAYDMVTSVLNPSTNQNENVIQTYGDNSALSVNNTGLQNQFYRTMINTSVSYDRTFGLNQYSGRLDYSQESHIMMGRNNSFYRQSYNAQLGYNYANRYLFNASVSRAGTSVLTKGDQFVSYPALSAGWILTNETFLKNLKNIDFLKLRASWGESGLDDMDYELDQQYWAGTSGYLLGDNLIGLGGLTEGRLAVQNLKCELSRKYNIGLDAILFKHLELTVDAFMDNRSQILVNGANLVSEALGVDVAQLNMGKTENKGLEFSAQWKKQMHNWSYYAKGNVSYIKNKVIRNGESFKPYKYMSSQGRRINQLMGLEAIGYFRDQADIDNSPVQTFDVVRPGDVKYKDMNGDHKIDNNDVHPIGYSTTHPEYSFGLSLGLKYGNFGVDMVWQGVSGLSKMINIKSVYVPLRNNKSNLSEWYLKDRIRWTEETKDIANVPRLSTLNNENNYRPSTQWLADGSFLKLRHLNLYYDMPKRLLSSLGVKDCQLYVRGNNLLSFDHIAYLNCEDLSLDYADECSVFVGFNLKF